MSWNSRKRTGKNLDFSTVRCYNTKVFGDVPKWLKGADSKSARRRKACGGSNPSISANESCLRAAFFIGGDGRRDLNPSKYNSPVDCCSFPARRERHHTFRIAERQSNPSIAFVDEYLNWVITTKTRIPHRGIRVFNVDRDMNPPKYNSPSGCCLPAARRRQQHNFIKSCHLTGEMLRILLFGDIIYLSKCVVGDVIWKKDGFSF